ncbi:hypothetical protein MMAN_53150 [Mycobacterium mantenii]|uniref:Uncharacterized protein n=1 Tax=Mycobacterium mantenii TaxID=560555 RepID=A0A1X0FPL2_MYCNT|nr:hypothetical protein [Mycobacterium mantenii]MCV7242946.1 hypothetical protein [Mycobacterium mantenii]ORB03469.1 hypothetical protein BST30_18470 [Mycobacterium mantenii]BBY41181.1 hypothetical protein MMAN_53150 [Mycobacterium mantenii]
MNTSERIELEAVLEELRDIAPIALSDEQRLQLAFAEDLLKSSDPVKAQVGANTLRALHMTARKAEEADFLRELEAEFVGTIDSQGLHRSLESEIASTAAILTPMMSALVKLMMSASLAICIFGAVAVYRLSGSDGLAAGFCLLTIASYFCVIVHMQCRLVQNAREADERMRLRSALARPFAKAVSIAAARGDLQLLDRIMQLMPDRDSEHSTTLGNDDLRSSLDGLAMLRRHPRKKSSNTRGIRVDTM